MLLTTGEFDHLNRISLIRVRGPLADESLAGLYDACHKYSNDTDASVSIVDLSAVSVFSLSCEFIRRLAARKSVKGDAARCCFIVAPAGNAFGLCRMFQLLGEATRPLLQVVHTLSEALTAIGTPSPSFAPSAVSVPFRTVSPLPVIT